MKILVTFLCFASCLSTVFGVYDIRCPANRSPSIGLVCPVCPLRCPIGQICCPTGCGSSCIDISPVFDPRCPIPPDGIFCIRFESCPPSCPRGQTCCPSPCGTGCRDLSPQECPDLLIPPGSNLHLSCSNNNNVGSICSLTCPRHQQLVGTLRQVTCQSSGTWSTSSLLGSACQFNPRCPTPQDGIFCIRFETCPRICPRGQTCCQVACGTGCVDLSPQECPDLLIPPGSNLHLSCSNNNNVGSICSLTCPRHQQLVGTLRHVTCQSSGTWSTSSLLGSACQFNPRCPKPEYGIFCVRFESCPRICPRGQTCCQVPCGTGCVDLPPQECPDLLIPPGSNLHLSCSNSNNVGSICTLTCPRYYELVGTLRHVTCQSSGTWSTSSLLGSSCRPIRRCPVLSDITPAVNFIHLCHAGNHPGSICGLSCATPGLVIRGGRSPLICLPNGQWNQNVNRIRCDYDRRCPPPPPFGICPACPPTCPSGKICCSTGCGSQCIPIPDSCPVLVDPDAQVSFTLTCSNGRRIGSRCNVTCPSLQRVLGVASTECQPNGIWSPALGNTQCISALTCLPVPCPVDPCNGAVCPGVPGSACAPDLCSGQCAVAFYANGRRVDKQDCIVEEPCILPAGRPAISLAVDCSFACRAAICPNVPDAVCKADCFCRARFYHPKTFEEVECFRAIPTTEDDDE